MTRLFPAGTAVIGVALASFAAAQNPTKPATRAPASNPAPTAAPISAPQRAAVTDLFAALKLQQEVQSMPESMIDGEIARNPGMAPFRDLMVAWLKKYMTWPAMEPQLMLLDEVTSALDPELVAEVLEVITELAGGGMTMLIATHEMGFARDIAHRVCFLEEGRIIEEAPPAELFTSPKDDRTRRFLRRIVEARRL